jgi:hypothetical protein
MQIQGGRSFVPQNKGPSRLCILIFAKRYAVGSTNLHKKHSELSWLFEQYNEYIYVACGTYNGLVAAVIIDVPVICNFI